MSFVMALKLCACYYLGAFCDASPPPSVAHKCQIFGHFTISPYVTHPKEIHLHYD